MTRATKAVKQEANASYPTVAEAQARMDQLGRGLDALRESAAEFARLKDAYERLPAIEAEVAAIIAAMPEIERKDLERLADEYEITSIAPISEGQYENAFRKYNVKGTYRGMPFTQALANQSRALLAAVARRPELIPIEVRARAADPFNALLRNLSDVCRGYRN